MQFCLHFIYCTCLFYLSLIDMPLSCCRNDGDNTVDKHSADKVDDVNVCSEQMHVTCSKSPGAVAVSMSTPSQFMVVSSATTGGVCTTVGNLPQPFNSSISSPSRVTAASHGIGLVVFGVCPMYCYSVVNGNWIGNTC